MIETNINNQNTKNHIKYILRFNITLIIIVALVFIWYALKVNLFSNQAFLINYIEDIGIWAGLFFIIIQIFQVIIPIIPGGISSLVGVLVFGPLLGFIYNYIGLVTGSIIAYYLAKKHGIKIIKRLFKEETINKYTKYINNNTFYKIFIIAIILPGFPDDLLCYIAGISTLNFKTFISIILASKAISLLMYSLFINIL